MSTCTTRIEVDVLADHQSFAVMDLLGSIPFPSTRSWVDFSENGITVFTLADCVDVPLIVEVWESKPGALDATWKESAHGRVRFTSGKVGINFLVEGEDTTEFEIAPGEYTVEVGAAQRPRLASHAVDNAPADLERYIIRIWPQLR